MRRFVEFSAQTAAPRAPLDAAGFSLSTESTAGGFEPAPFFFSCQKHVFYGFTTVGFAEKIVASSKRNLLEVPEGASESFFKKKKLVKLPRAWKVAFFGHFRAFFGQKRVFGGFWPVANSFGGCFVTKKIFIKLVTAVAALNFFSRTLFGMIVFEPDAGIPELTFWGRAPGGKSS